MTITTCDLVHNRVIFDDFDYSLPWCWNICSIAIVAPPLISSQQVSEWIIQEINANLVSDLSEDRKPQQQSRVYREKRLLQSMGMLLDRRGRTNSIKAAV